MKKLTFCSEDYIASAAKDKQILVCQNEYKCGLLEFIWVTLDVLSTLQMDRREHKLTKKLRQELKTISRFRDAEQDSRIVAEGGPHILLLEDDRHDILLKHLESAAKNVAPRFSELYSDVLDFVESAPSYVPTKIEQEKPSLRLVEETK